MRKRWTWRDYLTLFTTFFLVHWGLVLFLGSTTNPFEYTAIRTVNFAIVFLLVYRNPSQQQSN